MPLINRTGGTSEMSFVDVYSDEIWSVTMGIEDQLKKVKIPGLSALALSAL